MKRTLLFSCLALNTAIGYCKINSQDTIKAASCSDTDVQAALNSVTALTKVVLIPAGTCHWTSQVSLVVPSGRTSLSILGAGNYNITGGADSTVIVDDFASGNYDLSIATGDSSSFFRLAGLTFQGGNDGGTANTKWNGMIGIGGYCQNMRVDHMHINHLTYTVSDNGAGLGLSGALFGVTDHNVFDGNASGVNNEIHVYQGNLFGDSNGRGDGAWANPTLLGGRSFMFIEDNLFNNSIGEDCTSGGRFVVRYNTFNSASLETHPTGGGGADNRGCRAWEIYNNTFNGSNSSPLFNVFFLSSGTGVIWGNSAPTGYEYLVSIHSMRTDNSTYPETPTPNGWGYCGTAFNGTGSAWDQNNPATTGCACIDQPGRGKGDLITGLMPNAVNSATGTISWPHQALEPVYEWNDTWNPVPGYPGVVFNNYDPTVLVQNHDYYQYKDSFNGTVGVGSGLLAQRPSTCTLNTAYWASDHNTLYQCTATNTWTAYYTPYCYPHPLVSGIGCNITTAILPHQVVDKQIKIYPNPARDKIYLDMSGVMKLANVSIYTIDGQLAAKQTILVQPSAGNMQTENTLDVASFSPGMYYVQIANENFRSNQKIIIER